MISLSLAQLALLTALGGSLASMLWNTPHVMMLCGDCVTRAVRLSDGSA